MSTFSARKSIAAIIVLISVMAATVSAEAANHYVRQGATGSGNGADWTDACSGFTGSCAGSALVRGDTYYVADGSYGHVTFNRAVSGTALIIIKKATVADHGTNTGWQDAYGDGQATFGALLVVTSYYVFDGQTRNESNWEDVASYGFRSTGGVFSSALNPGPIGICADNLTFRYLDVGGAPIGNVYNSSNPEGFYMGGFGDSCSNWTISRSHVHNVRIAFQMAGAENALIEYSFIGPGWAKEAIRGQLMARGHVIRYNTIWNACQMNPEEGSPSTCTAEIAMWGQQAPGSYDDIKIYGNVIQKTTGEFNTGGAIVLGGDGTGWLGTPANNAEVYNNTIVGIQGFTAGILINGGSGNLARNNIWAGLGGDVASDATANTTSNNSVISTDAFVSYPTNLRLNGATPAGYPLPSPYNMDRNRVTRGADGTWDLGAYEGTAVPPPSVPRGVKVAVP